MTFDTSTHTTGLGLWGLLMFVALGVEALLATCAFIYVRRLLALRALPGADELNSYQKALRKLRKDEPMTRDEHALAERIIDIRRSPLALTVPFCFMGMGIFYVLGSLEYLHGHTPSERTFLGVIPMFTATNLILQMRKTARMRKRLPHATIVEERDVDTAPVPTSNA
ncbi:hypothetical protein MMAD_19220 [Mycolicibacterium madagascariense]|uniref:Uncharacterized protein n=1 Tax=Mycolicibacterium madagascariense TaxID=212765 RepID=A0A7I7XEG0_9MYCO|nr:hypothetical protein [Mycolicibacterium madagascariense]MCV7015331.1 hypothetical protein [Mycolicibacterium madagascariense]BBZ27627.1 hypothetical protein MMAD_19220 [Mycolicibacterium madagascariense]